MPQRLAWQVNTACQLAAPRLQVRSFTAAAPPHNTPRASSHLPPSASTPVVRYPVPSRPSPQVDSNRRKRTEVECALAALACLPPNPPRSNSCRKIRAERGVCGVPSADAGAGARAFPTVLGSTGESNRRGRSSARPEQNGFDKAGGLILQAHKHTTTFSRHTNHTDLSLTLSA